MDLKLCIYLDYIEIHVCANSRGKVLKKITYILPKNHKKNQKITENRKKNHKKNQKITKNHEKIKKSHKIYEKIKKSQKNHEKIKKSRTPFLEYFTPRHMSNSSSGVKVLYNSS